MIGRLPYARFRSNASQDSLTSAWVSNIVALLVGLGATSVLALALLWRLGSWHVDQSEALNEDEGLPIGSEAPQVACHARDQEFHLTLVGRTAFVAIGTFGCEPCRDLLSVAARHPATAHMRLVYLSDTDQIEVDPQVAPLWEIYRFHDEDAARRQWRAPVSPYFHVIDEHGRVRAKGVANRPEHLDRLLSLQPAVFDGTPVAQMAAQGG
jgi:hypothetical protein